MSTKSPINSEAGHHDHHERHFLGDILDDDIEDCLLEGAVDDQEDELVKANGDIKETGKIDKGKEVNDSLQSCFLTNGRSSSSGSSSNGDSRDSGFEGGLGSGSLSTPSSSRRTTTSSDTFSTPSTMSTTSEGLSPSGCLFSDKIVSNNYGPTSELNLQTLPSLANSSNILAFRGTGTHKLFDNILSTSTSTNGGNERQHMKDMAIRSGLKDGSSHNTPEASKVAFAGTLASFFESTANSTNNLLAQKLNDVSSPLTCGNTIGCSTKLKMLSASNNGCQPNATANVSIQSQTSSRSSPTSSLCGYSTAAVVSSTLTSISDVSHILGQTSQSDGSTPIGSGNIGKIDCNTIRENSIGTEGILTPAASKNIVPQFHDQHQLQFLHNSGSNSSAPKNDEGTNQVDVTALQQAVALLQMGNVFEGDMRTGDIEERKDDVISQQNQTRNIGVDGSKYLFNGHRDDTDHNIQGQRQSSFLGSILSVPPNNGMSAQHTNDPQQRQGHQFMISDNMQQPTSFQASSNLRSSSDSFEQNQAIVSTPTGPTNSALLQNLTALAKLDQLTSEQQQPVNMLRQTEYQGIGPGGSGDGSNMHTQRHDLLQRNSCNSSQHQMAAQLLVQQQRNNLQQRSCQQQMQPQSSAPMDQQSVLLQLAALAAATEQQPPPICSSSHYSSPRGWSNTGNFVGNAPFTPSVNQGFNSGMIGRHRNMSIGGRGSPTPSFFGHLGMESTAHTHDSMRMFRGDNGINRCNGSMFNEAGSNCMGGNMPSAPLRSLEQMNYSCNLAPYLNGSPFDVASQGESYASSGNGMIPASTTAELGSAEGSQMQIRCKFGQLGQGRGQFNAPHGFCLGSRDEEIVVADTHNHRIQIFDKTGNFRYMFGTPGKEEGCLWYPRKVVVMKNTTGNFVVCDRGCERSRMQIFSAQGHFIRRIAIRFIDIVAGLAVQCWGDGHIVAVDSVTPTIFVLAEDGRLIRYHECSDFMNEPSDIAVFGREYYICDFKGHSVVVVNENGQFMRRIGSERVTCFPNGIDISDAGDVLIGDSHGNQFHVAVYDKDAQLVSQFVCPNVKVSRCCGLKITMEGYIVTLAKNNHHVLVLNTLYVS